MTLKLDGTKLGLLRHRERVEAWLRGERIAPITIDMALTQKCQMSCVFCYANLQQNPAEPVAWEIYQNFLDDCVTIGHQPGEGVRAISLVSDGESTLNKFFYRFIEKAHANGLDIASGTNAEALKQEMMPMLVDKLTYLRVNMNASTAAANAKIMGTTEKAFERVIENVRELVRVKRERNAKVTIGLQMVLMPHYGHEVVPLAKFGKTLGVDYFVIKHCSDDEAGRIGVDYSWYTKPEALELLSEAEKESTDSYSVQVKWSKIKTGRQRKYSKCFGTPFLLQLSGTGVVAPCASFFHTRYKTRWIGDLRRERWRDIWASERYWEVINELRSERFDPRVMCETLCLQDKVNEALFDLVEKGTALGEPPADIQHSNFV